MNKINIYIHLNDESLRTQLIELLSADWALRWNVVTEDYARNYPEAVKIAVTDSLPETAAIAPSKTLVIFCGDPGRDFPCFSCLSESTPEQIFSALKRANTYLDISQQNQEAMYKPDSGDEALETVAQSLSAKIHQLIKQSEMRIALVDQLPVGVLGVDDEGIIVLANPKAIEELSAEDTPIWGMPAQLMLGDDVASFIKKKEENETYMVRYGKKLKVRKAAFMLEGNFAGTILVLISETSPDQTKGK